MIRSRITEKLVGGPNLADSIKKRLESKGYFVAIAQEGYFSIISTNAPRQQVDMAEAYIKYSQELAETEWFANKECA